MTRVLLAPDSFKGSLSALRFCQVAENVFAEHWPTVECISRPLADGGDGTAEAFVLGCDAERKKETVCDPFDQSIVAEWGWLSDKTAVVELAAASGITLYPPDELDPLRVSTFGTGQLIKHALDAGCETLIIGLGGSATNDGGMGLLAALGVLFLDDASQPLRGCGDNLAKVAEVDASQ